MIVWTHVPTNEFVDDDDCGCCCGGTADIVITHADDNRIVVADADRIDNQDDYLIPEEEIKPPPAYLGLSGRHVTRHRPRPTVLPRKQPQYDGVRFRTH